MLMEHMAKYLVRTICQLIEFLLLWTFIRLWFNRYITFVVLSFLGFFNNIWIFSTCLLVEYYVHLWNTCCTSNLFLIKYFFMFNYINKLGFLDASLASDSQSITTPIMFHVILKMILMNNIWILIYMSLC